MTYLLQNISVHKISSLLVRRCSMFIFLFDLAQSDFDFVPETETVKGSLHISIGGGLAPTDFDMAPKQ